MKHIKPGQFEGPRAYFTNFDHRIVTRTANKERLRQEVERRLKILLLTKSTVVCAASHLTSDFTYQLFRANPVLLNQGLITPALRDDKKDVSELFEKKRIKQSQKDEMIDFYRGEILQVVDWPLFDNSKWFKDRFIEDLQNENSVLRNNLKSLPDTDVQSLISALSTQEMLGRDTVEQAVKVFGRNERRIVLTYRELLYHISGARVVNCESSLPQEDFVYYSLADIEDRRILLSELQIFWKMFLEIFLETLQRKPLPLELLDELSFADVVSLRSPILESQFQQLYDELVKTAASSVKDDRPEKVLLHVEELLKIKDGLSRSFQAIFEEEIPKLIRKKAITNVKSFGKNSVSIGLGIASFFEPITTVFGVIMEGPSFLMNLGNLFTELKHWNNYQDYVITKETFLRKAIERSDIDDKAPLADVARMLLSIISKKVEF